MEVATHPFAISGLDNARAAIAIARVAPPDLHASVQQEWLAGGEFDRLDRFKVGHARCDFVAGRIAAKSALMRLTPGSNPSDWELVGGIWRQPCVRGPAGGLKVTLAHSGGSAVAVAFDDRWMCGIDLELSTREAAEVVQSQVTEAETAWARSCDADATTRWMLLWTAREAIGKAFGTGLLFPDLLPSTRDWSQIDGVWQACVGADDLFAIRSMVAGRFVVSWMMPAGGARSAAADEALKWVRSALAD